MWEALAIGAAVAVEWPNVFVRPDGVAIDITDSQLPGVTVVDIAGVTVRVTEIPPVGIGEGWPFVRVRPPD
jgi:hypothetical protein